MFTGWTDRIPNVQGGFFEVKHFPQGRDFGAVDLSSPPKGAAHTTEGTGEVPAYGDNAPQFTIGRQGLYQHRAFGRMAGTLRNEAGGIETNRLVRIQFELVEFSELEPWLPESDLQCDMLASVFEWAAANLEVPETHVWPDEQDPGTIAVTSYRRRHSKFPHVPGWYYHAEVPENSHWDMGDCLVTKLMKLEPLPELAKAHAVYISYRTDHASETHKHSERITPFFSDPRKAKEFAFANRKANLFRAMSGRLKSKAHGGEVIKVKGARPHLVTKRVPVGRIEA